MRITEVPFAVMRFQYEMARLPFQLIEEQVVARLGAEAPARLFYERSLGVLDATVGAALGDLEIAERGVALAVRSDALDRAAELDATAAEERQQTDDELKAKRDKAIKDQKGTREAKQRTSGGTPIQADQRKHTADEASAKRAASAKHKAAEVAARRNNAADMAQRDEARIQQAEQNATAAAESQLKDVQQKRSAAATQRAQADQIEELTDEDKQMRLAEPVNNPNPENQPLT
jgi:hypothetical protein